MRCLFYTYLYGILACSSQHVYNLFIVLKSSLYGQMLLTKWGASMSILPKPNASIAAQPARNTAPRRLIVTAGLVAFAIRDWSLWVLLRVGPWGPPMRLVTQNETVSEAIDRTLDALLL